MNSIATLEWAAYFAWKAMPAPAGSGIGAGLSGLISRQSPGTCRRASSVLSALRPEWADDPAALETAMRNLWACFARNLAEVPYHVRLVHQDRVVVDGIASCDAALASGAPVILLYLHTGNFDLTGMHLAFRYPGRIAALFDPPSSASQAEIIERERSKAPWRLVPTSRMVWRQALLCLREGNALLISADELATDQVGAPFFGRPPRLDTNIGKIARLAMRTGATVVPLYNERHKGLRFTTHVLPTMRFDGDPCDDGAVLAAVEALDAVITPPVVRLADQWFMALHYRGLAVCPSPRVTVPSGSGLARQSTRLQDDQNASAAVKIVTTNRG